MTLNAGDEVTFDVSGGILRDDRIVVGCQSAPLSEVLVAAESVKLSGREVEVTGLRGKVDRDSWGTLAVTIPGVTGVIVSVRDLESRATNINKVTPAEAPWQNGDVVLPTDDPVVPGPRIRINGMWVRPNGSYVGTLSRYTGRHSSVDARVTADVAAGKYTALVRGGRVVDSDGKRPFRAGDRVRLIRDIGSFGTVGKTGRLESHPDFGGLALRLDEGRGGAHGNGLYTLGLSPRPGGRTIEETVEHI